MRQVMRHHRRAALPPPARFWTGRGGAGRALATGALLAVAGCGKDGSAAEESGPSYVNVGSESVAVVTSERIEAGPVISGTLRAENEAAVRAQVGGTVVQVYADRGESVARGALLARIEGVTAEQAQISAQAAAGAAERNLQQAQREASRVSTLVEAGALAERDLENARNAVAAAQAQLASARAQLAAAAKQVQNTQVRAPFSGVVSERPVNAGDVVAPGAALFTVVDPSGMRLEASVPSDKLGQVRVGAPVSFTVSGYPGRTFVGRVDRINPSADPVTRQVPVYVTLPNAEGQLVSGLFAEGRVASESRETLVVPASAVNQDGAAPAVLRVRGGVTEAVQVRLGISDPTRERIEIVEGVAAGDTLLTGAAMGISAKTPVRVSARGRP